MSPQGNGPATQEGLPRWLLIVDVAFAALLLLVLILTLVLLPSPTPDQRDTLHILTAVLFGALGACLAGTAVLKVNLGIGTGAKFAISATAGIALLLIAYLIQPYWTPPAPTKEQCIQNSNQPTPVQRGC